MPHCSFSRFVDLLLLFLSPRRTGLLVGFTKSVFLLVIVNVSSAFSIDGMGITWDAWV